MSLKISCKKAVLMLSLLSALSICPAVGNNAGAAVENVEALPSEPASPGECHSVVGRNIFEDNPGAKWGTPTDYKDCDGYPEESCN